MRENAVEVTQAPIEPRRVIESVRGNARNGAAVSFIGTLRDTSADGRPLRFAESEGERQSAEELLRQVVAELESRWQLEDVAICHRSGRIDIGDVIMVVAVAAPRRRQAFEALQYAVDRAKDSLSIREVL